MLPRPSIDDRHDVGGADTETCGEITVVRPVCHEPTDLQHLGLLESGPGRRLPSPSGAMPEHVVHVGLMRIPSEVFQVIIGGIAVMVAANLAGWTGTDERFQDEAM